MPNVNGVKQLINNSSRRAKESNVQNIIKYVHKTREGMYPTGSSSYTTSSYQAKPPVSVKTMSDLRSLVDNYNRSTNTNQKNSLMDKIIELYNELKEKKMLAGGRRKKSHKKAHKKHARRTRRHR